MKRILFLIQLLPFSIVIGMEKPEVTQESEESSGSSLKLKNFNELRSSMAFLVTEEKRLKEKRELSPILRESLLFEGPVRRNSEGNTSKLDCQLTLLRGNIICDKADNGLEKLKKAGSIIDNDELDKTTKSNDSDIDIDELDRTTEGNYLEGLTIFIEAYEKKCFAAFPYITTTLKSILEVEQLRKTRRRSTYTMYPQCDNLYERIQKIYEQEHKRKQSEKKSEKRMSGFAAFTLTTNEISQVEEQYAKAKILLDSARGLKENMKEENIEQFNNIETVCFEAIDLFFQAFDANKKEETSEMIEETFEFIQKIETAKVTSNRLSHSISPRYARICQKIRDYREKNPSKPIVQETTKKISWQEFLQLPMKEKEEAAPLHEARIQEKEEEKTRFKKIIEAVQDKLKIKK